MSFSLLIYVKMRQDWDNRTWLQSLKGLSEHDDAEVTELYH